MYEGVRAIAETIDVLCAAGRPDLASVVADTWRTAEVDHLTGVQNRASFEQMLEYERERARRYDRDLSVLVVDVDDFKRVNDTMGHLAGDDVLRAVATHLARSFRSTDRVARIGGDEFAVILPETSPAQASRLAERVAEGLRVLSVVTRGGPVSVSVTVGVAALEGEESVTSLFDRADQALLDLKRVRRTTGITRRARPVQLERRGA